MSIDSIGLSKGFQPTTAINNLENVKKSRRKTVTSPALPSVEAESDAPLTPVRKNRLDTRPELEKPFLPPHDAAEIREEVTKILSVKDKLEEKEIAEIFILRTYIEVMKEQRNLKESDMKIMNDTLHHLNKANQKIREDHFNQSNDVLNSSKISKILTWVSRLIYGGSAILGISSIAATIATGGAALPAALMIANGIAGLSSALGTAAKGALEHKYQVQLGQLEEIKLKKHLTDQKIKEGIREMSLSMNEVSRNWQEIFTVINNWTRASLNKSSGL